MRVMPWALAMSTARSVGEVRETNMGTCILAALFNISAERRPVVKRMRSLVSIPSSKH